MSERKRVVFETPAWCRTMSHDELGWAKVFQRIVFSEIDDSDFMMTLHQELGERPVFENTIFIKAPFNWKELYEAYRTCPKEFLGGLSLELISEHGCDFKTWQLLLMQYLFGTATEFWISVDGEEIEDCEHLFEYLYCEFLSKMSESQIAEVAQCLFKRKSPLTAASLLLDLLRKNKENRPLSEILSIVENTIGAKESKECQ